MWIRRVEDAVFGLVGRAAAAADEAGSTRRRRLGAASPNPFHGFKRRQIRAAYFLAAVDARSAFHVTRQPGEMMAWPIQVHSIESDKAW
jgi:hypothetical protein